MIGTASVARHRQHRQPNAAPSDPLSLLPPSCDLPPTRPLSRRDDRSAQHQVMTASKAVIEPTDHLSTASAFYKLLRSQKAS